MSRGVSYWVMKSEPECFSIDDLRRSRVEMWDGVRNFQVRNMMRDDMKVGDMALFYHSNAGKETGVVGVMTINSAAYPDPTQFEPQSEHPDPASDPKNPRWLCVDVRFLEKLRRIVTLSEMKQRKSLQTMRLLQKGNRLSVVPVTKQAFDTIIKMSES